MSKKIYSIIKSSINNDEFDEKKYHYLFDDYLKSINCKADKCQNLDSVKKSFGYILKKYKQLKTLQKQNTDIFSQMLHDIKSPMLGIKYALETIERSELEDEIYNINLSILQIIQDFLSLYSFKDGFKNPDFEVIQPLEILKKEYKLYLPLFKHKSIKMVFKNVDNIKIYSHGAIFSRIVSNLISNAIKYAPPKSEVYVEFLNEPHNITIGVSNVILSDKKSDENSFGMGLLISKRLARRINATLFTKKYSDKIFFGLKMPKIDRLNRVR